MSFEYSENIDQVALRRWIEAGLHIYEVRALKGDAGYLLNNMIAKYTLAASCYSISELALDELKARGIDLSAVHPRREFYGKKGGKNLFIYEHTIPAGIVRRQLLSEVIDSEKIKTTLSGAGQVAIILRTEDERIRKAGLASKMPSGWKFGDDPLARHQAVDIKLSARVLKVEGPICR